MQQGQIICHCVSASDHKLLEHQVIDLVMHHLSSRQQFSAAIRWSHLPICL